MNPTPFVIAYNSNLHALCSSHHCTPTDQYLPNMDSRLVEVFWKICAICTFLNHDLYQIIGLKLPNSFHFVLESELCVHIVWYLTRCSDISLCWLYFACSYVLVISMISPLACGTVNDLECASGTGHLCREEVRRDGRREGRTESAGGAGWRDVGVTSLIEVTRHTIYGHMACI